MLLLFVLPGMLDSQYFNVQTLTMIFSSAQILILLAIGATLVMLTRNIDVSVGSITGMCAVLLGLLLNAGYPLTCCLRATTLLLGCWRDLSTACAGRPAEDPGNCRHAGHLRASIAASCCCGQAVNGLKVCRHNLKLSALVFLGISAIGWLTLLLMLLMALAAGKTAFGRCFMPPGIICRVRGNWVCVPKPSVFWPCSTADGGAGGIAFASQIGFIPNQTGTGLGNESHCRLRTGWNQPAGGSGTIIGAVLGAYFLTHRQRVLVPLRIPAWWNDFIAGFGSAGCAGFDGRLRCALEREYPQAKNMPVSSAVPCRVRQHKAQRSEYRQNVRLHDDSFTSIRLGTGARRATGH